MPLPEGYTDLPPGRIANVVTCLEMLTPPEVLSDGSNLQCELKRVTKPDIQWYRALFRRIGQEYLWCGQLRLTDEQLSALLCDERLELYSVRKNGRDEGIVELDFRQTGECELLLFGISAELIGSGVGRWAMNHAIRIAWEHPIHRFWLHTCTFDHPAALGFYIRSGFRPFKRQIEVLSDPRLIGVLPRDAASHVPVIS